MLFNNAQHRYPAAYCDCHERESAVKRAYHDEPKSKQQQQAMTLSSQKIEPPEVVVVTAAT